MKFPTHKFGWRGEGGFWEVVAAAAVSAGANAYAAKKQSDSINDTFDKAVAQVDAENRANEQLYKEGRGADGFAQLPFYAEGADGQPFEPQLFEETRKLFDRLTELSPEEQLANLEAIRDQFNTMQGRAISTAEGIFDGGLLNEARTEDQNVAEARNQGVASRKQAGLESLKKTLNQINAIQAQKGFQGDSFGNRLLKFGARREINTDSASDQANVNILNADDSRRTMLGDINRRINNIQLPNNLTRSLFDQELMPENTLLEQSQKRSGLFDPFKIGVSSFQNRALPLPVPTAGNSQIIAQGVGSFASSVGDLYGAKALSGGGGGGAGGGKVVVDQTPVGSMPNYYQP